MTTVDMVFWDVQHGHAVYARSPNGRHIAVDFGSGSYGASSPTFSPLLYLKKHYGVEQLDYAVITHPHLDHIDDILNFDLMDPLVLQRPKHLSREDVMKDVQPQDKPKYDKYFEISDRYASPVPPENNPVEPQNWGGLEMKVFLSTVCPTSNINNHSIILVTRYATMTVVLTGDNEDCSLKDLLGDAEFVSWVKNADLLLAPHHGRQAGYYADFVDVVKPRLTIVSDGRFCDTSATTRYSEKSRGWTVHRRDGKSEQRKCLTTRNDGDISVSFGWNSDRKPFLSITID